MNNMHNVMTYVSKFLRDEEGLTTVEYAIAGGMVGAGAIAAFAALGGEVGRIIGEIKDALVGIDIAGGNTAE